MFPFLVAQSLPWLLTWGPRFAHREWEFSGDLPFQKLVKIEDVADVAVSFILEEWGHLDQAQKSLSRDDRKENCERITPVGKNCPPA